MVVKPKLKWYPARNCWRKRRRNRVTGKMQSFYLGKGQCDGPEDEHGYLAAWAEWLAIKAKLEEQEAAHAKQKEAEQPKSMAGIFEMLDEGMEERPDVNLDKLLASYLQTRQAEVQAGEISPSRYLKAKAKLNTFQEWCHEQGVVTVYHVNEKLLENYRTAQLSLVGRPRDQGGIGKIALRERLELVRAFVWWLYETARLEHLPRNLRSFTRAKIDQPTPTFWTLAEVRRLFRAASPDMRLWIALACNTGWTAKDIATLEHEHVNWRTGVVTRGRSKTGVQTQHKLWPWVLALLKQHRSKGPAGPVLTAKDGSPLVWEKVREGGTGSRKDRIGDEFRRLRISLGYDSTRGFKTFRKTSANMLARQYQSSPQIERQFLGHVRQGLGKHYTEEHYEELFAALGWLDGQYALHKELAKAKKGASK